MTTAEEVVQRQLETYNKKDIEAWLSTYSLDAQQFEINGNLLASGHSEIRSRMTSRFTEPALNAKLLNRTVMENIVVDHEIVTRNFPEGLGTVEMICIYEVSGGLIKKATFAIGTKKLV